MDTQMVVLQQTIIFEGCTEDLAHQEQHLMNKIEEIRLQEEILWKKKSESF